MKTDWTAKTALITGASSGIGEAIARRLSRAGIKVLLSARRKDRLQQLAAEIQIDRGQAHCYICDLADEAQRLQLYQQVMAEHGRIDILVNNAGLGWYGYAERMPWKVAAEMIQVNIAAAVHFTLLALPKMRELDLGHIINIGSVVGSLPSQGVAVYGATKSFLDHFTTAIYRELTGTHVHISVLRAGPVQTEFCQTALAKPGGLHLPTERMGVTAAAVAGRVWQLLIHPRRVTYIPAHLSITPFVETYFGWLIDKLGPLLLKKV